MEFLGWAFRIGAWDNCNCKSKKCIKQLILLRIVTFSVIYLRDWSFTWFSWSVMVVEYVIKTSHIDSVRGDKHDNDGIFGLGKWASRIWAWDNCNCKSKKYVKLFKLLRIVTFSVIYLRDWSFTWFSGFFMVGKSVIETSHVDSDSVRGENHDDDGIFGLGIQDLSLR